MLRSSKFWVPVILSILVALVITLFALGNMWAPSHVSPGVQTFAELLFPYGLASVSILDLAFKGSSGSGTGLLLILFIAFAFLGQFPIYGVLLGYANVNGHLKRMFYWIIASHALALVIASFLKHWSR